MNIFFDNIIFSIQKSGGISVVWSELLKRGLNDTDFKCSFLDISNKNLFREQLEIPKGLILKNSLEKFPIAIQRYMNPSIVSSSGIFHSSYYRTVKNSGLINITSVHDFTYEYFRSGMAKFIHSTQKANAIRNAHRIICVSENTKADLLKFHPSIKEDRVEVIYNGVDDLYSPLNRKHVSQINKMIPFSSGEYVLYIGDRKSSYKNFKQAVTACRETDSPIVIVGGGQISKSEKDFLSSRIGLNHFIHLDNISNTQLNVIYNHALCLLYPSSYEGFGIPIIESQKAGCPVICYNCSSIPEVAGKSALLLDEVSAESISEMIKFIRSDSERVTKLIESGFDNAKRFSWKKCYRDTKNMYINVYKEYFNK